MSGPELRDPQLPRVRGRVEPAFRPLAEAFARTLAGGGGAALCVYVDGEAVVDVHGGLARPGAPWDERTLVCTWSVAKGVLALATAMLVDRGLLDLDRPIAEHWPAFAAAGKQRVTTRHVLTHTAGLPWLPDDGRPVSLDSAAGWSRLRDVLRAVERAPAVWPPGERFAYHSFTQGFVLSGLFAKVTGAPVGDFVAAEIMRPLAGDLRFRVADPDRDRVADLIADPLLDSDAVAASIGHATDAGRAFFLGREQRLGRAIEQTMNDAGFREAEVASVASYADARSLARMYACLANGGTLGAVTLLRRATLEQFAADAFSERDVISGDPFRMALGFQKPIAGGHVFGLHDDAFGHPGFGGSVAFADPRASVGFSYLTNRLVFGAGTDDRVLRLQAALRSLR